MTLRVIPGRLAVLDGDILSICLSEVSGLAKRPGVFRALVSPPLAS
jgi:hypothetical protein